jgi:glycosyltransferase involved in cell wall biosynthesis
LRILLVSSCLPHAGARHAGGKLVHYLRERLAERHEVTEAVRFYPGEERTVEELRTAGRRIFGTPAQGIYHEGEVGSLLRALQSVRALTRLADRLLVREPFDVCQVEFTETGLWWPRRHGAKSVLSCHDLLAKPAVRRLEVARGADRIVARLMLILKRRAESGTLAKFGGVFVLSELDAEWARRIYPAIAVDVLRYPGGIGFAGLPRTEIAGRVGFLGTLQRSANAFSLRYFLREVWPLVLARESEAEFVVAGVGAPPELVDELAAAPRVRYLGEIASVESFYAGASVFVAPVLIGGGVIVKVLDALAAGAPVVTTSRGNEGVGAVAGRDLEIGDSAEEMAARVVDLLRDPERRSALGRAGRTFERETFSAGRFAATLEAVYERVAGGRSGSAA